MSVPAAQHSLYWLPNALTVSRIIAIPVLVFLIIASAAPVYAIAAQTPPNYFPLAAALFAACMFTDWLDGFLARRWEVTSAFGRMLDPIADKLLVAGCLIAIAIISLGNPLVLGPALVIIGRDIFVSGIREHAANSNVILSPTKLAKWKTAFEMLSILLFLLAMIFPAAIATPGSAVPAETLLSEGAGSIRMRFYSGFLWVLAIAAALSAYTGFHYFRSAMRGKPTR